MKTLLLLSSGRFLNNELSDYIGKSLKDLRIAHITTASKGRVVDSLAHLDRVREVFKKNNCYFEDLDLDGKNEEEIRKICRKIYKKRKKLGLFTKNDKGEK